MKIIPTLVLALIGLTLGNVAFSQDTNQTNTAAKPAGAAAPATPAKPQATVEELEATFKATLTNATFNGRWCTLKDGQMSAEKEDKYTLLGATKLSGDRWVIQARIQYGERDMVAPIPVQVKWAGDTPVIIVDNLGMPGGKNRYSARVLIYDKTYAGTWSAGDHGGLLSGVITNRQE